MSGETERKIQDLLAQALAAKDAQDVERVLVELRKGLEEHILHAKISLAAQASLIDSDTPSKNPVRKAKSHGSGNYR